jgi:hypothetical protein
MADLVHTEYPAIAQGQPGPSESATLKIVMEPLGIEVDCTMPERHSAKMVQLAGIAMAVLGPVLMLWVAASTDYPAWATATLVLALLSAGVTMSRRRY